jgi:hypothetical protein
MAEAPSIEFNTQEQVAFKLYQEVYSLDRANKVDKKWILDTYAECLQAVKAPNTRLSKS